MFNSREVFIRRYTRLAAVFAVLCAPLLASAYFQTAQGAEEKGEAVFTGWVDGVEAVASPLVEFASSDTVYVFYSLIFAAIFPAVLLAAREVRRSRRTHQTRPERVGWALALTGYALSLLGGALVAPTMLVAGMDSALADIFFLALMFPGLVISVIGSTLLGISFIRSGFEPRGAAWLLALAIPLWVTGSIVLGHNSLGLIPLFLAWALALPPSTVQGGLQSSPSVMEPSR